MKIILIAVIFLLSSNSNAQSTKLLRNLTVEQVAKINCSGIAIVSVNNSHSTSKAVLFKKPVFDNSIDKKIVAIYKKIMAEKLDPKKSDLLTSGGYLEIYTLIKNLPFTKECVAVSTKLGKNCFDKYKNGTKKQVNLCRKNSGLSKATTAITKKYLHIKK